MTTTIREARNRKRKPVTIDGQWTIAHPTKTALAVQGALIEGSKGASKPPAQYVPVEAPQSLRSKARGRILDLIAHGPIVGLVNGLQSILLDDTPLQNPDGTVNFEGVVVQTREGYPDQAYIPGFTAVENSVEVNAEIKFATPIVRSVTNNDANAVIVTVAIQGLTEQKSNGDLLGYKLPYAVDVRQGLGAWTTALVDTIDGKTTATYQRSSRIPLNGPGPFDIRVRRTNQESAADSKISDDLYWSIMTEVIDARLNYPDSALVAIDIDAELFGSKMPARYYDMELSIIKVPSNYNPRTREYTGFWDGTFKLAWSDNPAWCYYDLATHPVIGANNQAVDKWSLYRIAQYCDGMVPDGYGGMERRFSCNTLFASREEAITTLNTLASVWRGMVYWGAESVMAVGDMPGDVVKLVSPTNITSDGFEYVGTSLRERHSVAVVMWNDPNDGYKQVPEMYEDPESIQLFGWRETQVTAACCTSRGQARRLAKWILYSERMETEIVSYTASTDHSDLRPGDFIKISDPDRAGVRLHGRIKQTGVRQLTLDKAPANLPNETWYLSCVMPSGTIQQREVLNFNGAVVTLKTDFPEEPIKSAVFILSSAAVVTPTYRVMSVIEQEDGVTYQISATEHNPNKYDFVEFDLQLPPTPDSAIPSGPLAGPDHISVTTYKYITGGAEHQALNISWSSVDDVRVTGYILEVRDPDDVGFRTVFQGNSLTVDEKDVIGGEWSFRVKATTSTGRTSEWVNLLANVAELLKPAPPDQVKVIPGTLTMTLSPVSLYPNQIYEFWRSSVALPAELITTNATKLGVSNYFVDTALKPLTTYYYYVRGVNIYGVSQFVGVQGTTLNDFDDILQAVTDDVKNGALYQELQEQISTTGGALVEAAKEEINQTITDVQSTLTQSVTDVQTNLNTVQGQLSTDLRALGNQLHDLDQQVDNTNAVVSGQLADLGTAVAGVNTEIAGINTEIAGINTEIDSILTDALAYNPGLSYVEDDVTRVGKRLYQAITAVPPGNSPPNATYWMDVGQVIGDASGNTSAITQLTTRMGNVEGTLTAQAGQITNINSSLAGKADAGALSALTTRVTTAEGSITSQGSSITNLTNSLTTTNTNVTAAQNAANAANTLAGGKGKVLVQSTTPVAGDQLAQNLWIDTTGGANTPKRWSGSAWAAVTDKVATDAAAAAAAALSVANTKADASAVNSLTNRVTATEGTVTSQGSAITGLNNSLTTTNTNVTAAQNAANAANTLAGGKGKVLVQSTTPVAGDQLAQNLWIDTTGGANTPKRWSGSAWLAVTDKVATDAAAAAASALTQVSTKADASAVNGLTSRVTSAEGTISSQGTAITGLNNSLTTTNTNVTAAQNAANAANTLAGGKGKVIVQAAAPAVADRLAQNLWIDITGGANTPKRWTGSVWEPVTDKVATDAAEAAAAANALAATKADASAVTALTSRVSDAEGILSSNTSDITQLKSSIGVAAPFVAGKTWEFTGSTRGWVATSAGGTLVAGPQFATVLGAANLQCNFTPSVSGADNPYLRIRLRRRNTTRTGANLYWANEDGVLADARRMGWTISTTTTDWQDIEIDLTGHAQWNGKNIIAIRLDAMFSTDTTGEMDIAYVALGRRAAAASAEALSSMSTVVTQQGGTISSQGASITSLNNSLTTANTNVTAAQNAANAANTLAGGKGKVLVQSTTPVAGDQLAQNLWIDITGGANTPKRWSGSAWLAVTDKVATDAAAAAANALSVANTKADASALTALTTRVTTAEGSITSQGSSITNLTNSLTTTNTNVTAAQNAANAANTLAGGKGKVLVQSTTPVAGDQLAQNLWIDTTGGANTPKRWSGSAWLAVTDKVATDAAAAAASALTQVSTKADASAVNGLTSRVTAAEGTISSQGDSITSINNSIAGVAKDAASSLDVIYSWQFDVDGDQQGWTPVGCTVTAAAGVISVTNTGGDPSIISAVISVSGELYPLVRVRLKNKTPRVGDFQLFFSNIAHSYTEANSKHVAVPVDAGFQIITFDMTGVGDWSTSTITRLRLDTGTVSGDAYDIDWIAVGRSAPGASSAALASLSSAVTQQGTTLTSQGSSLTSLNNSLTTTNTNVTAAQNAANAANTLAGGKGKVIVQTAAPAVADRLAQNLWIDITGGANTPKRWTGSVWEPVTDKVATDAAAAAANALSVANTKADASAVTSLSNTVTQQGNTIAAQGTAVTGLTNRIANAEGVNTAQSEAITQIDSKVTEIDGKATSTAAAFNALDAKVGDNAASLTTLEQAMVTADQALSQQLTSLQAKARQNVGEGDLQDALAGYNVQASFTESIKVLSDSDMALSQRVTGFQAQIDDNAASLTTLEQAMVTTDQALSQQITTLNSDYQGNKATVTQQITAVSNQSAATAGQVATLQTSVNGNTSAIQVVQNAQSTLEGKLTAQYAIKLQLTADGRTYAAGMGLDITTSGGITQSSILFQANRIAMINTDSGNVSIPFLMESGTVYINNAMFKNASIDFLKISDTLQSDNYSAANKTGWRFSKAGTLQIFASGAKGSSEFTGADILMRDTNGTLRIKMSVN